MLIKVNGLIIVLIGYLGSDRETRCHKAVLPLNKLLTFSSLKYK